MQGLMKFPQKYGRPDNSTTYCSDTVTQFIEPKIDNNLRKNQNGFRRNRSTTTQILTIRRILEGVRAKTYRRQYYLLTLPRPLIPFTYGRAKAGRPARTYIQQLCEDTGCSPEDLPEAMNDREEWRGRVRDICAGGTT